MAETVIRVCKHHGETEFYAYTRKSGKAAGKVFYDCVLCKKERKAKSYQKKVKGRKRKIVKRNLICEIHGECEHSLVYYGKYRTTTYCKYCYRQKAKEGKQTRKKKIINYGGGKCKKCSYSTCDAALEFHHVNPKEKDFGLAKALSWEKTKKEVDKCVLLCANCHREFHAGLWKMSDIGINEEDYK